MHYAHHMSTDIVNVGDFLLTGWTWPGSQSSSYGTFWSKLKLAQVLWCLPTDRTPGAVRSWDSEPERLRQSERLFPLASHARWTLHGAGAYFWSSSTLRFPFPCNNMFSTALTIVKIKLPTSVLSCLVYTQPKTFSHCSWTRGAI